jgi:alpha-L-arabinofuranosidase
MKTPVGGMRNELSPVSIGSISKRLSAGALTIVLMACGRSWGAAADAGQVVTYPAPAGEALSADYRVQAGGQTVDVYMARVLDPPFAGKEYDYGGPYSFANFDMAGPVVVRITSERLLRDTVIRPPSAPVKMTVDDDHALSLTLDRPCKFSVEPDGKKGPLLLFANPLETEAPKEGDPNVVYFGPGVHKPEKIALQSNQTLYLAGGAVVKAEVLAQGSHIRIRGRGILDGSDWEWRKGPVGNLIAIRNSSGVEVRDITLRGSSHWTIVPRNSRNVTVRNVKICGSRVQNDDGINPCNSQDVRITDCFIRSDDDCVALKGLDFSAANSNIERITVENCTLWCDRARIFLLGHESRAAFMRNVTLRNLDIIHFSMTPFLLEPGEDMHLEDITMEDIRIHGEGQREFIRLRPVVNQYMRKKVPGFIRAVRFKNVTIEGRPGAYLVQIQGADAEHNVSDVTFENVSILGPKLAEGSRRLRIGEQVSGVRFHTETADASSAPDQASFPARVTVTDRVRNTVRPWLFGDNIEWVNDGMGLWLPQEKEFRADLVEELRAAGVTHLRYPGGTLSDFFDWDKAVGTERQPIPNPFAEPKGKPQYPHFGPDEFMALCRRLSIPGTITLNAGSSGSPARAAGWVKYCRDRGFAVTGFTVGNEIYMAKTFGEPIPSLPMDKTPQQYVELCLAFKDAMEKVAPGARLGAIGLHDTGAIRMNHYPDWMEVVLSRLAGQIDFIDVHCGYAPVLRAGLEPNAPVADDDTFAQCMMGAAQYVAGNIEATKSDIRRYAAGAADTIDIHISEYGPLVYPFRPKDALEDAAWNRSLAAALYQACLFNVFLREPKVTCANHLPLCQDVFGALIGYRAAVPRPLFWRNAVFYVFQMYSRMKGRDVLAVRVEAPVYATPTIGVVPKLDEVPYLDAVACRTGDGPLMSLFLINRDVQRAAQVAVELGAPGWSIESVTTLTADSYKAANSPEDPTNVVPRRETGGSAPADGQSLSLTLPRHSLTVVDLRRAERI